MYHKILAPLDGSPLAEKILPHIENLARDYGAEVVLARVVEPRTWGPKRINAFAMSEAEVLEEETKEAEAYLAGQREKLCQKGISGQACVVYGRVVEAIVTLAGREEVDLIAMASHGRTGLAHVFYGSVAAGLLHRIDRPILLIRALDGEQ